jgi:signal transduction histidine kinase
LTIYRVVQEALNNIIIHAEATEINFQLLQSDKEITMMIEDNGKGFDIGELENKHGIGLRNIRSRVENIGGKLHLDSVISRGTIVTIIIPIKNLKNEY